MPDKADGDKSKKPNVSRLQSLRDIAGDPDLEPDMPDAGAAQYLLAHFWAVGPSIGDSQVTQGELRTYQDNTGLVLTPWECSTLRRLSIEHLNESGRARAYGCKAPWEAESNVKIDRALAAKRAQQAIRELAKL